MTTGSAPLFSILMPVFNGAAHIQETIASLQAQTFGDFELLVMDDGSTDNTAAIVQQLAASDSRISLHRLTNGGAAYARNQGLQRARGKFIAVNDADDLWPEDRLANQYAVLQEDETRIVIGGVQRFTVDEKGEKNWGYITCLPENNLRGRDYVHHLLSLPENHMAIFHTLCGKKDIIAAQGGWDKSLVSAEDWDHWLRLGLHANFYHLDKVLLYYRKYPNSVTSRMSKDRSLNCQLSIIKKAAKMLPLSIWAQRHYAGYRFKEAIQNFNYQGNFFLAQKTLLRAAIFSNLPFQKAFYSLALDLIKGMVRSLVGKR